MNIFLLYAIVVLIWGSTWFVITLQLGVVDPMVSIFYRFAGASILLFLYCKSKRVNMRFRFKEHLFILLQGFLLFTFSYYLVYLAEMHVTSGLVAVVTSMLIFLNMLNSAIFLGNKIRPLVFIGAAAGLTGIVLIFWKELSALNFTDKTFYGLSLTFISTVIYSLGNIVSARNQKHHLPVLQTNAYSMGYASLILLIGILATGKSFGFDLSFSYIGSLIYLSLFGSVVAFGCYLSLIGLIGPDKAAYGPLVNPVMALILSSIFEGYRWSVGGVFGLLFIILGNFFVLRKSHD